MGEVEDLICQIKEIWPQLHITKESLLRPTQEFVFTFYSNFISELNAKMAYLMGTTVLNDISAGDHEPEERLFQQMSEVLKKIHCLRFTLADIYQPVSSRTKLFFKVCTHFTAYTESLLNEAYELENEVSKTKVNSANFVIEQQEVLNEINENARLKAELPEINKNLSEQYKYVKNSYKEMKEMKTNKEKMYAEIITQIETLKREMLNEEYELEHLESVEKGLTEKKITQSEYENILHTLETLKSESEILDNHDVNMEDGLVHGNEVLQHTANCMRVLSKYEFNDENVKKLINEEEELKTLSNQIEKLCSNKINPVKYKKLETEKKLLLLKESLSNLQLEYKSFKEQCVKHSEMLSHKLNKSGHELRKKTENDEMVILKYKEDIAKLEDDMDKLKNFFTTEYIRVSKFEKGVVEKFKEVLLRFKSLEE